MADSPLVKSPDAPALEPSHPLSPKPETRFNVKPESEDGDYAARYIDLPPRRRAGRAGRRNLLWGAALLFAALLVLAFAVLVGGPRAVLWPFVALITFTALWVLARLQIFRQRHGVFLALAVVALLSSVLAIGERGFDRFAGSRLGATLPNVATSAPDETPPAPEPPPATPLLSEEFHLAPPDPADGSRVKIVRDTEVTIARKTYRVQAGETFPLDGAKDGAVTFVAGEYRAKISQADVQILGPQRAASAPKTKTTKAPAPEPAAAEEKEPARDPAAVEIETRARAEALRRFPALASANSPENQEFVKTYRELKAKKSAMLDDPEWPIRLAEILAQSSNWEDAGTPEDEVVGRPAPAPREQ